MTRRTHDRATIARFVATGLGAALLLFALNWGLALTSLPAFAAGFSAYALAFAAAYLVQRGWSFGGRHTHRHALPRYLAAQALAALTSGGSAEVTASTGLAPEAGAAAATVAASAVSMLLSLFWVFPARGSGSEADP